ncbi:DC-STAMP domain-containing protein 2, partial [Periophthalmus magnuspinnatus]|uniref:DC-STAMP domain-containing protein 2 n=1 Tax=Periophthalmus magnuspinnatus TaxID=409849 RepID=UPI0024364E7B
IGFGVGLFSALLFGAMLLFLQKFTVWNCAYITVGVACVFGFGMGLSKTVRADAAVMLPSLCSNHGKTLVSLVLVSVVVSGPISNSFHNIELAASSILCSTQLSANQTQEMLRRAASPLSAALDNLRDISNKAYKTANRIQNLIDTLTDGVRHIARTLRNLLHFLVDIGDICNKEMGVPYRKCRQLFEEARLNCNELLGDFDFLCELVDGFMPLCDLAKAAEVFCVIPSYVAEELKKRLATPVVAALEQLKKEFVFDLDASVTFDLEVNSSQSLQEVTQQILKEVTSELHMLEMLSQPLNYLAVLLLVWNYYKAARYRRRYLRDLYYDNIYINTAFKELDRHVTSKGGASVLPITARESQVFITPFSLRMSNQEREAVLIDVYSALRHLLIGGILMAVDFLIFWILDQVHHQASVDIVVRSPVKVQVSVNGSGFAADIYRDLVHSFQILQDYNLTVFSQACVVKPRHPDIGTAVTIGFLLGLSLLLAVCKGFIQRTRRVVCSWFHPERERERLSHLRSRILEERRWEKNAQRTAFLRASVFRSRNRERIEALLHRIPGGSRLLRVLGLENTSCLSCSNELNPEMALHCDNSTCSAVYCGVCLLSWAAYTPNSCLGCGQPLISQDDQSDISDLELGSSDDEESGTKQNPGQIRPVQDNVEEQQEIEESGPTRNPDQIRPNQDYVDNVHPGRQRSSKSTTLVEVDNVHPGRQGSSKSTTFIQVDNVHPSQQRSSRSTTLVQIDNAHPSRQRSSKSTTFIQVDNVHPSQQRSSRSTTLIQVDNAYPNR